jgi:sporulation protein YqfC
MSLNDKKDIFLEKAADILDLPEEVVAGMPRITVTGCRRVMVENHRGILEYGDREIQINGGRMVLTLRGENLELRSLNTTELLVTGRLTGMEFEY